MPWLTYYLIVAAVVLAGVILRVWVLAARRHATTDPALAKYGFGVKFNEGMDLPHDQSLAEQAHKRAAQAERRARKVAAGRTPKPAAKPSKVAPIRKQRSA